MMASLATDGAALPRQHVVVDSLHVLESESGADSSTYRVPRSLSMSIAVDQCCSCPVYSSAHNTNLVEMSVFVPTYDPSCIHLHCEGSLVQQFPFPNDTILSIKLLPLVACNENVSSEFTQVVGVIVIIASLRKGISIYSVILEKSKGSAAFVLAECREVGSESPPLHFGRRIRSMTAAVVNTTDAPPFLLLATSTSLEEQSPADQSVQVQRYTLCNHKCPLFQFSAPAEAVCAKLSPPNETVTVGGE